MPATGGLVGPPWQQVVEYVVKVASRCNIACDHCYVYADPDRRWLAKPVMMDPATARAAATRIAEHAEQHQLAKIAVILHGGEPLLLGAERLATLLAELRMVIEPAVELDLRLQSNGIRLSAEIADVLADQHVTIGISLDGDKLANDRHRRYRNGSSSHAQVLRALELLRTPPYRSLYGGILCTIDVDNDPIRVYEAILREEPPRIDFLLPHATWDSPPPGRNGQKRRYAEWLLTIFDRWTADQRPVSIRIFDSILALEGGSASGTESLGVDTSAVAVVETDGTWEQVDSLKTVSEDAPWTGLDVDRHSVDEFLDHVGLGQREGGALPPACSACPVAKTCGGGLYAHRFASGNGFANPSVYCADLFDLITGVRQRNRRARRGPSSAAAQVGTWGREIGRLADLPPEVLRDLASAGPTAASLSRLTLAEYAVDRTLVAAVAETAMSRPEQSAIEMMIELDRRSPAAVRAVLCHPFVRSRAKRSLTSPRAGVEQLGAALLTSLAVAAAVRAGHPATLEVVVERGELCLPGIGVLSLPGATTAVVSIAERSGTVTVRPGHGPPRVIAAATRTVPQPDWRPVRTVGACGPHIRLDDVDPYRDCFAHPVTATLSTSDAWRWACALGLGWAAVRSDAPELADSMDGLISTVTPTRPVPHRPASALTTRTAFGAVALPLAAPQLLGSLLVEAVAKLVVGAVHDLCRLDDVEPRVTTVGRSTRRPGTARLAEAFARAASLQLLTARMEAGRPVDQSAARSLHDTLARSLDSMDRRGRWTESGRLLLTGLHDRVDRLAPV